MCGLKKVQLDLYISVKWTVVSTLSVYSFMTKPVIGNCGLNSFQHPTFHYFVTLLKYFLWRKDWALLSLNMKTLYGASHIKTFERKLFTHVLVCMGLLIFITNFLVENMSYTQQALMLEFTHRFQRSY